MKNHMKKYTIYVKRVENDFALIGKSNLEPFSIFLKTDFFSKLFFEIAAIPSISQYM